MFVKGLNYHEEKRRLREEKREAKHKRRDEKREEKHKRREEKREEKNKYREAKHRLREEFKNSVKNQFVQFLNSSLSETTSQHNNNNNNVVRNNSGNSSDRMERDIATIRTIFPNCDPTYIRDCLERESGDRVRKVTEKLLFTVYPTVQIPHSTTPTAPPLPSRSSCEFPFNDEPPPSYEESLGQGQLLQPPPLPKRHQRSSSWNGTSITSSAQSTRQTQSTQYPSELTEVADAISATVKNLISNFKPSTAENAYNKNSRVWTRPVPTNLRPQPLSQPLKVLTKDKTTIQKGFHTDSYPSRKLYKHHDISEEDWYLFINGLNSIIGVNSTNGSSSNLGDGFSVSLKWVSWLKVTMDENQMEINIKAINDYLNKWNNSFFIPRKIMVQFVDDRTPTASTTNSFYFKSKEKRCSLNQYLLVTSI